MTYTAELSDYERLLAKLSHRALKFAQAQGVTVEFDELFQEAHMTFVVAQGKFDPKFGVKFSTYLWTAVKNNLSALVQGLRDVQFKTTSMDKVIGDDVGTLHDLLPSTDETQEDRMERLEVESEMFRSLSEDAKSVISILNSPPEEMVQEIKRQEAFRLHCKANNMAAASRPFDVTFVCNAFGFDQKRTRAVKREFKIILEKAYG